MDWTGCERIELAGRGSYDAKYLRLGTHASFQQTNKHLVATFEI